MATISGYLERRRASWEVVVDVPPSLREAVGRKRLRKGLGTRDKHIAEARKPRALLELHRRIDDARRKLPATDPVMAEAMAWRETITAARAGKPTGLPVERFEDPDGTVHEAPAVGFAMGLVEDRAERIAREEGAARGRAFADIAAGVTTPTTLHLDEWLAEPGDRGERRLRTVADYRGIVKHFAEWQAAAGHGASVEAVTRRVAGLYAQHLERSVSATRTRTVCGALMGYWRWMEKRGVVAEGMANPWERQAPGKARAKGAAEPERAFTDDEVAALLGGPTDAFMRDLMRFGALTGARLEELARLTVGMCGADVIRAPGVKGSKVSTPRDVPVHPDLAPIIVARTKGKPADAWLFPEFGDLNKHGERSGAVSKRFNRYRQEVGVHEREEGRRRSRVNFHSFRRWFSTRAIAAGQEPRIVEAVIGHKPDPSDVLMRSYVTARQLGAKLRECVLAVKLPASA
jgi:integrase